MQPQQPIKVTWNRLANVPASVPFEEALTPDELERCVAQAQGSQHPAFQLAPELFIEIPPPSWGHGDFLAYLPRINCMVRRNYAAHWYVDIGIFKPYRNHLFGWTDLWLDVIAPEPAHKYLLLDADEFAQALREKAICLENAALAMDSLHHIATLLRDQEFPPPQVRQAEAFYERFRQGEHT